MGRKSGARLILERHIDMDKIAYRLCLEGWNKQIRSIYRYVQAESLFNW
jgi:hypothetical protein